MPSDEIVSAVVSELHDAVRAAVAGEGAGAALDEVLGRHARSAASALDHVHPDHGRVTAAVEQLCEWFVLEASEGTAVAPEELARRADLLLRSVRGLPVGARIEAEVVGLALSGAPVVFRSADGFRVRLDPDGPFAEPARERASPVAPRPGGVRSVWLRLEYETADGSQWQVHVDRAVAILALFGVGGVAYTLLSASTDSLVERLNPFVLLPPGPGSIPTYTIGAEEAARLPAFWDAISAALPSQFYRDDSEDPDGLERAWMNYRNVTERYGYANERTAGVVRSLESLLLAPKGESNLRQTLAKRASSLLGACGFDPGEVHRTVLSAYTIRNAQYHGRKLSAAEERAIGEGGVVPILERCLDYNRAALVATLLARVDQPGLLRLLRDSPEALRHSGNAYRDLYGRERAEPGASFAPPEPSAPAVTPPPLPSPSPARDARRRLRGGRRRPPEG